jgi:hypothetical protein
LIAEQRASLGATENARDGHQGLSSNVIKQVWRDGSLMDLPRGTRIGVDARSTLHKSVFANARDIYFEKAGSHTHRAVFVRHLQQLLHPAWRSWSYLMALVGR